MWNKSSRIQMCNIFYTSMAEVGWHMMPRYSDDDGNECETQRIMKNQLNGRGITRDATQLWP